MPSMAPYCLPSPGTEGPIAWLQLRFPVTFNSINCLPSDTGFLPPRNTVAEPHLCSLSGELVIQSGQIHYSWTPQTSISLPWSLQLGCDLEARVFLIHSDSRAVQKSDLLVRALDLTVTVELVNGLSSCAWFSGAPCILSVVQHLCGSIPEATAARLAPAVSLLPKTASSADFL